MVYLLGKTIFHILVALSDILRIKILLSTQINTDFLLSIKIILNLHTNPSILGQHCNKFLKFLKPNQIPIKPNGDTRPANKNIRSIH